MKKDLVHAISLFNFELDTRFEPSSFLDFTILMSLYYLQLHIMQKVISGSSKYSNKVENYIRHDKWLRF